jgi:hypothetical protein
MKILFATLSILLTFAVATQAATAKKRHSRAEFTKEEQAKIFNRALEICRQKHGDRLHRVEVDYPKNQFVCWAY